MSIAIVGIPSEKGEDKKSNNPNLKRGGGHKERYYETRLGEAVEVGADTKGSKQPSRIFAPEGGKGKNNGKTNGKTDGNGKGKNNGKNEANGGKGKDDGQGYARTRVAAATRNRAAAAMWQPAPPTTPAPGEPDNDKGQDWNDGFKAGQEAFLKWKEGFQAGWVRTLSQSISESDILLDFVFPLILVYWVWGFLGLS